MNLPPSVAMANSARETAKTFYAITFKLRLLSWAAIHPHLHTLSLGKESMPPLPEGTGQLTLLITGRTLFHCATLRPDSISF